MGDPIWWNGGMTKRNGGINGILYNTEYTKTRNLQNTLKKTRSIWNILQREKSFKRIYMYTVDFHNSNPRY